MTKCGHRQAKGKEGASSIFDFEVDFDLEKMELGAAGGKRVRTCAELVEP